MFKKVVVAVDESTNSGRVLDVARSVALESGAEIRLLHVVELGIGGPRGVGEIPLEEVPEGRELLDRAVSELQSAGASVTGVLRSSLHGRVASEIAEEARSCGADSVIVGTRGLTDLEGLLVGSVTHKLLHVLKLPVLVVP